MTGDFDLTIQPPAVESTIVAAERTQAIEPVMCPVCDSSNPPGEEWCGDCGFLLGSEPGEIAEAAADGPRLVDEATGREYWLVAGENGVGREGPEVALADAGVSRRHARVTLEDSSVWVEDLGSTNGTKVDGVAVPSGERRRVRNGERVAFGTVTLRVLIPGAEEERADEATVEPEAAASGEPAAWLIGADGTEYPVPAANTTLGRSQGNGIVLLGDPYVSGQHGQILVRGDDFLFDDLGSTNGSLVNDQRVTPGQPVVVVDGDQLMLGRTALVFRGGRGSAES